MRIHRDDDEGLQEMHEQLMRSLHTTAAGEAASHENKRVLKKIRKICSVP